ncbi:MAG: hypothetical protein AAGD01_10670 [Acidobacteriota bacterium]
MTRKRKHALDFHRRLPSHIWDSLADVGIVESVVHAKLLGYDDPHLVVPIFASHREIAFFEYWIETNRAFTLDVERTGSRSGLYGRELLRTAPGQVVFCETSIDRLILISKGFAAVSLAGTQKKVDESWIGELQRVKGLLVWASSSDSASCWVKQLVGRVPSARLVRSPSEGSLGSVVDFFATGGRTRIDLVEMFRSNQTGDESE